MTKTSRKVIVFMVMLMIVGLYFVSGTYARYASSISGNAKVSAANWVVAFKHGNAPITDISNLTFEVQNNQNVVPGKIAPSVTAEATINLDLTGTEVAVDYTATIDKTALATVFGASADDVTVTVGGEDSATGTINLVDNAAFTAQNGIVPIKIAITWNNDDTNNETDTTVAGKDLTLPVTLTVKQHID